MKVLIVFSSKDIGGAEKSITIMSHFIKNISDEFFYHQSVERVNGASGQDQ